MDGIPTKHEPTNQNLEPERPETRQIEFSCLSVLRPPRNPVQSPPTRAAINTDRRPPHESILSLTSCTPTKRPNNRQPCRDQAVYRSASFDHPKWTRKYENQSTRPHTAPPPKTNYSKTHEKIHLLNHRHTEFDRMTLHARFLRPAISRVIFGAATGLLTARKTNSGPTQSVYNPPLVRAQANCSLLPTQQNSCGPREPFRS